MTGSRCFHRVGATQAGGEESGGERVPGSGRIANRRRFRHGYVPRDITGHGHNRGLGAVLDNGYGLGELRTGDVKQPGLVRVGEEDRGPDRLHEIQVAA